MVFSSLSIQVDSAQMISLVCHDILSSDYHKTMSWIKICQRNAPNSKIQMLLTKTDLANKEELDIRRDAFVKGLGPLIDKEIGLTKRHLNKCSDSNKSLYEKWICNYSHLKKQIESSDGQYSTLEISCKHGNEASVEAVIHRLKKFAEHGDHQVIRLRPIEKELYMKIGKLGIKQNMTGQSEEMSGETHKQRKRNAESHELEEIKSKRIRTERQDPKEIELERTYVESNDNQPQPQHTSTMMQQKFLTFKEVLDEFKVIYTHHYQEDIPENDLSIKIRKELKKSLENIKERGLLRYFIDRELDDDDRDRELKDDDIIFHDLSTLVNILRCVFHHNLDSLLTFDHDDDLCLQFYEQQSKFDEHRKSLHQQGIMSLTLLGFLLKRSNCLIEAKAVAQMLSSVCIAIIFKTGIDDKQKLFIPYFLKPMPPLPNIKDTIKEMSRCKAKILSLETTLNYDIPLSFFNELQVKICKKIPELLRIGDNVEVWDKGMLVYLDECDGRLLMYYEGNSVKILLQANISEIEGHTLLFEYVAFIDREVVHTRNSKYPGLPLDYVLTCTHCTIETNDNKFSCALKGLLCSKLKDTFKCGQKNIPLALIKPLPKGMALNNFFQYILDIKIWRPSKVIHVPKIVSRCSSCSKS